MISDDERIKEEEQDPSKYLDHQKRLFDTFVSQIQAKNLGEAAEAALRLSGLVNIAMVGNVSVGKSTLNNAIFGEKLAATGG